jgi:two-component system response regulator (stage 0 sporulation protein F)
MSKKILVVDDEELVVSSIADMFKSKGYNVFMAQDGEMALDLIKKELPDLVLLDMKLPKVDGLEILRVLRQDYPKTSVIVMTAYDAEYKQSMDSIGYEALFVKPLQIDELKEKVEYFLNQDIPISEKKSDIPVIESQRQPKVTSRPNIDTKDIIPQARILIIELRHFLGDLLKQYLSCKELSKVDYTIRLIEEGELMLLEDVTKSFKPDIVLFDIFHMGLYSDYCLKSMNLSNPPKEIILFGDPKIKLEEVDTLIERGTKFIETPLIDKGEGFKNIVELTSKEAVDKLSSAIKETCLKYGLYKKEEAHGNY